MPAITAVVLAIVGLLVLPTRGAAQSPQPSPVPAATGGRATTQVISVNPFGLLIDFFNSEYEIRATDTVTVGAGASSRRFRVYDVSPGSRTPGSHHERYLNGDIFVRYYPGGQAFAGRSFGVKAGITHLPTQGSYFGIGFDANQSWMLNEHFYFGSGVGLKRLFGNDGEFDLKYIPTLRLNIGVAF